MDSIHKIPRSNLMNILKLYFTRTNKNIFCVYGYILQKLSDHIVIKEKEHII